MVGNRPSLDVIPFGGPSPSVHGPPNVGAERIARFHDGVCSTEFHDHAGPS